MVDLAGNFADVKQRLRRDASPIQANAARFITIDANDALAELAKTDRHVISTRTGADDDNVNFLISQALFLA